MGLDVTILTIQTAIFHGTSEMGNTVFKEPIGRRGMSGKESKESATAFLRTESVREKLRAKGVESHIFQPRYFLGAGGENKLITTRNK